MNKPRRTEGPRRAKPGGCIYAREGGFYAVFMRNGIRRAHRCATKQDAREWLDMETTRHAAGVEPLTIAETIDAREALALLPAGMTLTEAVRAVAVRRESLPVREAVAAYFTELERAGMRPRYLAEVRRMLARLRATVGDRGVDDVEPADLVPLMTGGAVTRNNWRRCFVGLWSWAKRNRKAATNPAAALLVARVDDGPPGILDPPSVAAVLTAGSEIRSGVLVPFFALGFFGGVRTEEIRRLRWQDIDLPRGLVLIGATTAKTRQRRLLEIRPPLGEWLAAFARSSGPVVPMSTTTFHQVRGRVLEAAGVEYPHNAARHSYASYRFAATGDAGRTATELGHGNVDLLYRHYREIVTPEAAAEYFELSPGRVMRMLILALMLSPPAAARNSAKVSRRLAANSGRKVTKRDKAGPDRRKP